MNNPVVLTIGLEAHSQESRTEHVDGRDVHVPEHYSLISTFVAVDDDGYISMHSALTGLKCDAKSAAASIDLALRHYPVDGDDVRVVNERAMSRLEHMKGNQLRDWRPWEPKKGQTADITIPGHVVGWGIAVEVRKRTGAQFAPYIAVQTIETYEEVVQNVVVQRERPLVVHARMLSPTEASKADGFKSEDLAEGFKVLKQKHPFGRECTVQVRVGPGAHYLFGELKETQVIPKPVVTKPAPAPVLRTAGGAGTGDLAAKFFEAVGTLKAKQDAIVESIERAGLGGAPWVPKSVVTVLAASAPKQAEPEEQPAPAPTIEPKPEKEAPAFVGPTTISILPTVPAVEPEQVAKAPELPVILEPEKSTEEGIETDPEWQRLLDEEESQKAVDAEATRRSAKAEESRAAKKAANAERKAAARAKEAAAKRSSSSDNEESAPS